MSRGGLLALVLALPLVPLLPLTLGCSALASATSYNKHTDLVTNGELGQLFATHGDEALGDAPVSTPTAKYALTIVRHDAYDQKCNSTGLAPQSLTPLSGGGARIPFPDESCTAAPPLPELDFVDASCDAGACAVTNEPSSDATHLGLTVTVPSAGDAHLSVHVRRRDTGADLIDQFTIKARVPDHIAVYNGDRTSPITRSVFEDSTLQWCMTLTGGGLAVEIPAGQSWALKIDGAALSLQAPFSGDQNCVTLQAGSAGTATAHVTNGNVSRDLTAHVAALSSAVKIDLYTIAASYHPEQQNDVEVDPVGDLFVTHEARPTRHAEVWFSLVSVVTLADGSTALGGAFAAQATELEAATPSLHPDDSYGDDAYLDIGFLFPVKTAVRGNITSTVGTAKLVFPMTVQPE